MPGAGHLTIFNNRLTDADGRDYSAVIEIAPPVDTSGRYVVPKAGPFGPSEPVWTYEAADRVSFHSSFISGAHRLPNGNTFICSGAQGRFFEVSPKGAIVWEYWNPYSGSLERPGPPIQESRGAFRATKIPPDHLLSPPISLDMLLLSSWQKP